MVFLGRPLGQPLCCGLQAQQGQQPAASLRGTCLYSTQNVWVLPGGSVFLLKLLLLLFPDYLLVKIAAYGQACAAKLNNMNLIPRTHKVEGEN